MRLEGKGRAGGRAWLESQTMFAIRGPPSVHHPMVASDPGVCLRNQIHSPLHLFGRHAMAVTQDACHPGGTRVDDQYLLMAGSPAECIEVISSGQVGSLQAIGVRRGGRAG